MPETENTEELEQGEIGFSNEFEPVYTTESEAAKQFQYSSVEDVVKSLPDAEQWEKKAASSGGDYLKWDTQEWVYKEASGKESSITDQVTGELKGRHTEILEGLFSQGFAISERVEGQTLLREVYFADEKGKISYEVYSLSPALEIGTDYEPDSSLDILSADSYLDPDPGEIFKVPEVTAVELFGLSPKNQTARTAERSETQTEPRRETLIRLQPEVKPTLEVKNVSDSVLETDISEFEQSLISERPEVDQSIKLAEVIDLITIDRVDVEYTETIVERAFVEQLEYKTENIFENVRPVVVAEIESSPISLIELSEVEEQTVIQEVRPETQVAVQESLIESVNRFVEVQAQNQVEELGIVLIEDIETGIDESRPEISELQTESENIPDLVVELGQRVQVVENSTKVVEIVIEIVSVMTDVMTELEMKNIVPETKVISTKEIQEILVAPTVEIKQQDEKPAIVQEAERIIQAVAVSEKIEAERVLVSEPVRVFENQKTVETTDRITQVSETRPVQASIRESKRVVEERTVMVSERQVIREQIVQEVQPIVTAERRVGEIDRQRVVFEANMVSQERVVLFRAREIVSEPRSQTEAEERAAQVVNLAERNRPSILGTGAISNSQAEESDSVTEFEPLIQQAIAA
jgi:hypothetical protein